MSAPHQREAHFLGIKRQQASVVRGVSVLPLALGLLGLLALLGSIVLAWFVEGRVRNSLPRS